MAVEKLKQHIPEERLTQVEWPGGYREAIIFPPNATQGWLMALAGARLGQLPQNIKISQRAANEPYCVEVWPSMLPAHGYDVQGNICEYSGDEPTQPSPNFRIGKWALQLEASRSEDAQRSVQEAVVAAAAT